MYKNQSKPPRTMISDLLRKFAMLDFVTNDLQGKFGAEVSVRTEEVIDATRYITADEPSTSTHRLASQLDISQSTATKILRMDIGSFLTRSKL